MHNQLIKLVLITSFGRGSAKPLRKVVMIFSLSTLVLMIGGVMGSKFIDKMNLAKDLPTSLLFVLIAVITFVIAGLIILPITQVSENRQSVMTQNLRILPLKRFVLWVVAVLPLSIVAILLTILFAPIIVSLSKNLDASYTILLAGYCLGLLGVVGLALNNAIRSIILKLMLFILISAGCIWALEIIVKSTNATQVLLIKLAICLVLVVAACGSIIRYFNHGTLQQFSNTILSNIRFPIRITNIIWYAIKLLRNPRTLASFTFCLALSLSLSIFDIVKQNAAMPITSLILFGSFLTCSLASDVRGTARRHKTPEVVTLRGTTYFINSQIRGLVILNAILIAPLLVALVKTELSDIPTYLMYGLGSMIGAMMIGFLFSTLLVPENGELGSQFFTALLGIASFILIPKIFKFSNLSMSLQTACWLCVAAICVMIIMLIEESRRRNYGNA